MEMDNLSRSGRETSQKAPQSSTQSALCTGIYLARQFYSHITFPVSRKADIGAFKRPGCGLHRIMTDAKNKGEERGHLGDHKGAFIIMPLPPWGACHPLSLLRCRPASGVLPSPDVRAAAEHASINNRAETCRELLRRCLSSPG